MAVVGDTIFAKTSNVSDDDSDIWDDTALIQAYDNAVSLMKAQIPDCNTKGDMPGNTGVFNKNTAKKKKKKGKNKQKIQDNSTRLKWKVGDHCRAVYTEDGEMYEAIIVSVNSSSNQCIVRFLGYGNEEEQIVQDLLPSEAVNQRRKQSISETMSESEPGMDWHQAHRRLSTGSSRGGRGRGRMTPPFSMPPPPVPPPPPPFAYGPSQWPGFPGMPGNPFMSVPFMPPMFPGNSMFGGQSFPDMQIPQMPPPPPVEDVGDLDSDKEALHSMLIAWYMSGYHTGYYQGLKEGKKAQKKGATKTQNTETTGNT